MSVLAQFGIPNLRRTGESRKEGDGRRGRVRLDHRATISREWGLGLAVHSEAMPAWKFCCPTSGANAVLLSSERGVSK